MKSFFAFFCFMFFLCLSCPSFSYDNSYISKSKLIKLNPYGYILTSLNDSHVSCEIYLVPKSGPLTIYTVLKKKEKSVLNCGVESLNFVTNYLDSIESSSISQKDRQQALGFFNQHFEIMGHRHFGQVGVDSDIVRKLKIVLKYAFKKRDEVKKKDFDANQDWFVAPKLDTSNITEKKLMKYVFYKLKNKKSVIGLIGNLPSKEDKKAYKKVLKKVLAHKRLPIKLDGASLISKYKGKPLTLTLLNWKIQKYEVKLGKVKYNMFWNLKQVNMNTVSKRLAYLERVFNHLESTTYKKQKSFFSFLTNQDFFKKILNYNFSFFIPYAYANDCKYIKHIKKFNKNFDENLNYYVMSYVEEEKSTYLIHRQALIEGKAGSKNIFKRKNTHLSSLKKDLATLNCTFQKPCKFSDIEKTFKKLCFSPILTAGAESAAFKSEARKAMAPFQEDVFYIRRNQASQVTIQAQKEYEERVQKEYETRQKALEERVAEQNQNQQEAVASLSTILDSLASVASSFVGTATQVPGVRGKGEQ